MPDLVSMSSALVGSGAVKFLFTMLGVVALAIWSGVREDKHV